MGRNPGVAILMLLVLPAGLAGYLLLGWLGAAMSVSAGFALIQMALERGDAILLGWLDARPLPDRLAAERLGEVLLRALQHRAVEGRVATPGDGASERRGRRPPVPQADGLSPEVSRAARR